MNTRFILILLVVAAVLSACGTSAPESAKGDAAGEKAVAAATAMTYQVDPGATQLRWIGTKVTGQHNGTINVAGGSLQAEGGKLTAGNFTLDMTSIKVLDIPADDEGNAKLVGHLNSPDFFAVDGNPVAEFAVTSVSPATGVEGVTHNIKGNLTIKGITKEISIPAAVEMNDGNITAEANFSFDRTDFGIEYGSGKFFEDLGDKMINDEVKLELTLVANAVGA